MKTRTIKIGVVASSVLLGNVLLADGDIAPVKAAAVLDTKSDKPKRKMRGNMTLKYNVLPGGVATFGEMFTEGVFYGRLRSNTFYWDWGVEDYLTGGKQKDNKAWGVGGSLEFKSGYWNGIGFTVAYYGSMNPDFFRMDTADIRYVKAGKDTFSRYKIDNGGGFGIHTLGQAFLEYKNDTVNIRAGRQMFESVFTASNDTKMIPNTFDGVTAEMKIAPKTKVRLAWFGAQKLRDHENAHDVVTFKNANGESWGNNDDAAVHKGLNYNAFLLAGEDPNNDLFLADIRSKYFKNLNLSLSYLQVPGIVKDFVAEAHYKIPFGESGWAVRPGVRYFLQMDDGGGRIAADTNLAGQPATANGYAASVATSMDSSLLNARVDLLMPDKKGFFRLGYSKVADEADIFAPWRGFPTGGFTRAMAQYNWHANTESFMVRAMYKFTPKFRASLRYAVQDFDDNKDFVQADSTIWHLDTWYDVTPNFQIRTRVGIVNADDNIARVHAGGTKTDVSYNEYRLEFNYLF